MDVSILISWKTVYEQAAWSAGHCPFCQQLEAVRVEKAIQVVSIWFLPVSRQVVGTAARCDFCERPISPATVVQHVPRDEWSPQDGLKILVERIAPSETIALPDNNSDSRLHSLLAAASEASSVSNMDITFGMTTGAILGVAICLPMGLYLFHSSFIQTQLDQLGFAFAGILTGIVCGVGVGAIVQSLLKRGKVAFEKIDNACNNYHISIDRLAALSGDHSGLVRRSVRAVRESRGGARYAPQRLFRVQNDSVGPSIHD